MFRLNKIIRTFVGSPTEIPKIKQEINSPNNFDILMKFMILTFLLIDYFPPGGHKCLFL